MDTAPGPHGHVSVVAPPSISLLTISMQLIHQNEEGDLRQLVRNLFLSFFFGL
jgi:hypothetical protein